MKKSYKYTMLVLILIVLIILLVTILKLFKTEVPKVVPSTTNTKINQKLSDNKGVELSVLNAEFYDIKNLNLKFVVARIKFSNVYNQDIKISDIKTSEGLVLGERQNDLKLLESKGYDIKSKNIIFKILNNQNTFEANYYIPISGDVTNLDLIYYDQKINVPLSNKKNGNDLRRGLYKELSDGQNYKLTINKVFPIATGTVTLNGNEYNSSSLSMYAFMLDVESISNNGVVLESATFNDQNNNEKLIALNHQYQTSKCDNLLGKTINKETKGCILFEAYNRIDDNIVYEGKLELKFKDIEKPVIVEAKLNKEGQ